MIQAVLRHYAPMRDHTPWHRLFGIALTDLFTGRPWRVELEKELALKSRRLDVLIIERLPGAAAATAAAALADLPDGLENLTAHNVLSYKSKQEPLDGWELFASEMDRIRYGLAHYRPHSPAAQLLRYHLATVHRLELPDMAYTLHDLLHDTWPMIIEDTQALSPEQRQALLERMGVEDRLRGLAAEDRLRGLATEDRLRGLDPEQVKAWLKRTGH